MNTNQVARRAVMIGGTAAMLSPLVVLILQALSTRWFYPDVWPRHLSLDPIRATLRDEAVVDSIATGLRLSGGVTVIALLLAWPAARALATADRPVRIVAVTVLFLPSVLPAVGLAMGIDIVLLRMGLAGTYTGVVLAHLVPTLPYTVAVLAAAWSRHNPRLEEQAAVLGAAPVQRLLLVTLPSLRGAILVAGALSFTVSWSQYLLTLLAGSGRIITVTMVLFASISGGTPAAVATLALIVALPAGVLLTIAGRSGSEASRA